MKKIATLFLFLFIIFAALFFFLALSNNPRNIIRRLSPASAMQVSEFKYRLYLFGILPVSDAVLKMERPDNSQALKTWHMEASAKTLPMFSKIFSASLVMDSTVDAASLNPVKFRQKISLTGKPDVEKEIIYDQKEEMMTVNGVKRKTAPNTRDPLSLWLNILHMDFEKTKDFEMNINTNQKNYILQGSAAAQEIVVGRKKERLILAEVEIMRRDKNPYHKTRARIVLWKKGMNIPLSIKVFSSGLGFTARLTECK